MVFLKKKKIKKKKIKKQTIKQKGAKLPSMQRVKGGRKRIHREPVHERGKSHPRARNFNKRLGKPRPWLKFLPFYISCMVTHDRYLYSPFVSDGLLLECAFPARRTNLFPLFKE